jgi:hypothetical protein
LPGRKARAAWRFTTGGNPLLYNRKLLYINWIFRFFPVCDLNYSISIFICCPSFLFCFRC